MQVVNGVSYVDFVREWAAASDEEAEQYRDLFDDLPWPLDRILADVARLRQRWALTRAKEVSREAKKVERPRRHSRTGRAAGKSSKKAHARKR